MSFVIIPPRLGLRGVLGRGNWFGVFLGHLCIHDLNVTFIEYMNSGEQETIILDVLRVSSVEVLGHTKPLAVARPFASSNAKGHLKQVDCFEDIQNIAIASASSFKAALQSK